jgi:hypothetical protein
VVWEHRISIDDQISLNLENAISTSFYKQTVQHHDTQLAHQEEYHLQTHAFDCSWTKQTSLAKEAH